MALPNILSKGYIPPPSSFGGTWYAASQPNGTYSIKPQFEVGTPTGTKGVTGQQYFATQGTGGGGGGSAPAAPSQPSQPAFDPYAQLRGEIGSGWDNYTNSLNDLLNNGLQGQRTAQENIANSQYDQGVNQLGLQKNQGLQELGNQRTQAEQNQAKTLKDISSNLRNSFQAGNVYLGARGAGDSSAADQYSYALTKLGSQQRGDVMNNTSNILDQVNARETNLNNIYNSQITDLGAKRDQQINQVAQWFSEAQNQLKQQIAQGGLNKSQDLANLSKDLLNRGLAQVDSIKQNYMNQYNALQSWAMGHATDIGQLKQNLQGISQYNPQLPQAQPIVGTPQVDSSGNFNVPTGYGGGFASADRRTDLFGNPIA